MFRHVLEHILEHGLQAGRLTVAQGADRFGLLVGNLHLLDSLGVRGLLLFVAMPLKYLGDNPGAMNVIGPLHGFLYVVYLLLTFDLFRRVRWSFPRLVLMALAGTIPFLSFYAERKTSHELLGR